MAAKLFMLCQTKERAHRCQRGGALLREQGGPHPGLCQDCAQGHFLESCEVKELWCKLWVSCCLFSELKVVSKTWLSVSWLKDFLQVPDSAVCVLHGKNVWILCTDGATISTWDLRVFEVTSVPKVSSAETPGIRSHLLPMGRAGLYLCEGT